MFGMQDLGTYLLLVIATQDVFIPHRLMHTRKDQPRGGDQYTPVSHLTE